MKNRSTAHEYNFNIVSSIVVFVCLISCPKIQNNFTFLQVDLEWLFFRLECGRYLIHAPLACAMILYDSIEHYIYYS